jgi:hypothetical protein
VGSEMIEKYVMFLLILIFAYSPLILIFNKKIIRKKLFFFTIFLLSIHPLSTIFVPAIFAPELFDGALIYYLYLIAIYYFFIFVTYAIILYLLPKSKSMYTMRSIKKSKLTFLIFIISLFLFSFLVFHSNGVFLYDPRYGYQHYRQGVGFVWVFYITSVSVLYYFMCIRSEINTKKILFFIVLMFLTGSKKLILDVFLKSILVYLWLGKGIKKWQLVVGGLFLVILMLKLFDQFGAEQSFLTRASGYFEFMRLASLVFEDYKNSVLEFTYGKITLSSFWGYVPRVLYEDKPYAYGSVTLVEMYFPGLAETGHTPSFGMLTSEFVDFRWFAPVLSIIFNLGLLVQISSLLIVSTNANLNKRWIVGALLFILCPGFGFHLPIIFSMLFAFIIIPNLFVSSRRRLGEK